MRYENETPDWGDMLILLLLLFLGRLTISFVEAKFAGTFTASWVWVFAPVWIPIAGILLAAVVWGVIESITEYREDRKKSKPNPGE